MNANVKISETTSTELVTVETLNAATVFAPGGVDAILSKLIADVRAIPTDISTASGRAAVASLAYKVARSKTALDELGKNLVADLKKQTGAIDAERKTIRDRLDALKDEVRKPLTDWENAEKDRVAAHEAALIAIEDVAEFDVPPTAEEIKVRIVQFSEMPAREWQEFGQRAALAMATSLETLKRLLAAAEKQEAERAELVRLRAEQAAREQKEREERIAAEAAERARVEAEAKAKREAEETAARAAAEQRRIEQEKADAEARAKKAEADRLAAIAKAEADAKAAAEAAERRQQEAIAAERKRVADAEAADKAEKAKREANKQHRAKINNEALDGLMAAGLTREQGIAVITAIATGNVPHIAIAY